MTNLAHIAETALLLLAAYLAGCLLGYAARAILHAGRGTRRVTQTAPAVAASTPAPAASRPRSAAARLAASVELSAPQPAAKPKAPTLTDAPPSVTISTPRPAPVGPSGPKPATLDQPRGGTPDNLKQIKGIGPKIEASLYAMGIFHIDQIAAWNRANIDWVDSQLAFKGRIRRERWVEQALQLIAANGDVAPRLSGRA